MSTEISKKWSAGPFLPAITLMKKEKVKVPLGDRDDLYNKMTMERYGVLGALKIAGKTAPGKKF